LRAPLAVSAEILAEAEEKGIEVIILVEKSPAENER